MKDRILIIITAVMVFLSCHSARSENTPEHKEVVFAGDESLAPYSFMVEGIPEGFCVDLARILSATIDRNIIIRLEPWNTCLDQVRLGKIDGLIGTPVSDDNAEFMDYSSPIAEVEFAIFVESSNHYVNSLSSLEGTVVGVHRNSPIISTIKSDERITLVETNSVQEALDKLRQREVTAVVAEKNVALYYIQQADENISDIKIVGPPLSPSYAFALSVKKGNTDLLDDINKGLGILTENGTMEKLRRKWFGIHLAKPFPWKMVIFMTSGITGIIIILAAILWMTSLNATVKAKTRQIQLMSQRMVEKDKLAVLGKLAGQIAHELRTPLSIINNSVFLLKKEGPENRELFTKRLKVLEEKIKLSSNILESILSYSRVKAEIATTVSIKSCVQEVLKDIEFPEGISRSVKFENEDMLFVFMDFHQLYSVIRNIILNAVQAMGEKGDLSVKAYLSETKAMVNIEISDTGGGILESARAKIFNLFYSTKITGTGLGLPISKSIIEANDGELFLKETGDKGTCFMLRIPSARTDQ